MLKRLGLGLALLCSSSWMSTAQGPPNVGGLVPNQAPGVIFLGTPVAGNCVKIASVGPPVVLQDTGAPCGSGGGGCTNGGTDLSTTCGVLTFSAIGVL